MRIGLGSDWTGGSTQKFQIIAETTDGRYVLKKMPVEMIDINGTPYLADSLSGLFLRKKEEIEEIPDKGISDAKNGGK